MNVTAQRAENLICPILSGNGVSVLCRPAECMAWQFDGAGENEPTVELIYAFNNGLDEPLRPEDVPSDWNWRRAPLKTHEIGPEKVVVQTNGCWVQPEAEATKDWWVEAQWRQGRCSLISAAGRTQR